MQTQLIVVFAVVAHGLQIPGSLPHAPARSSVQRVANRVPPPRAGLMDVDEFVRGLYANGASRLEIEGAFQSALERHEPKPKKEAISGPLELKPPATVAAAAPGGTDPASGAEP